MSFTLKKYLVIRLIPSILFGLGLILIVTSVFFADFIERIYIEKIRLANSVFIQNIRTDILLGTYHQVDQKCESFFKANDMFYIQITDTKATLICNLAVMNRDQNELQNDELKINDFVYFDESSTKPAARITSGYSLIKLHSYKFKILTGVSAVCLTVFFLIFYFVFQTTNKITRPIESLVNVFRQETLDPLTNIEPPHDILEMKVLFKSIRDMARQILITKAKEAEHIKLTTFSSIAKQVSHDIRSPLSALNAMTGSLNQLPEDKRTMIRNAVLRINDIANDLLEKGRKHEADTQHQMQAEKEQGKMFKSIFLLAPLVDSIVSEKRIQYRDRLNISIEVDLAQSYGLFAEVNTMDLKRVISNLINNSCEAFNSATGGTINVAIRNYRDKVGLIVADNGQDIPESIMAKLGQQGVTHGKEGTASGSGLGIYHAKKTITGLGGEFQIASKPGMGTIITITFPKSLPPKWFVTELQLPPHSQIVALDDDQAIHNLWNGRFQSARAQDQQIQLTSYTSAENLIKDNPDASLYLMDYELLGQQLTGLDVIEKMGISSKSILVTSRYEEKHIFEKCEKLGVKLIPKNMAAFVPITIKS